MELYEKLQELRRGRGLTQEELADELFVSRTAVSKWESGRGTPSIDSLKEISKFFSVSIDELLSGEKLLSLAEREHRSHIQGMYDFLLGVVDFCSVMLILLPLYPNMVDGHVYSVNLISYVDISSSYAISYFGIFLGLILIGLLKIVLAQLRVKTGQLLLTRSSLMLSIIVVFLLSFTREAYAASVSFSLLLMKGILLVKRLK